MKDGCKSEESKDPTITKETCILQAKDQFSQLTKANPRNMLNEQ